MDDCVKKFFDELEPYRVQENVFEIVEGVEIGLRVARAGDSVYVMKIRSQDRGQGLASETLGEVCRIADDVGVELFLEVEESDGLTATQLAEWYWRFGFRGSVTEMVRSPRGAD